MVVPTAKEGWSASASVHHHHANAARGDSDPTEKNRVYTRKQQGGVGSLQLLIPCGSGGGRAKAPLTRGRHVSNIHLVRNQVVLQSPVPALQCCTHPFQVGTGIEWGAQSLGGVCMAPPRGLGTRGGQTFPDVMDSWRGNSCQGIRAHHTGMRGHDELSNRHGILTRLIIVGDHERGGNCGKGQRYTWPGVGGVLRWCTHRQAAELRPGWS